MSVKREIYNPHATSRSRDYRRAVVIPVPFVASLAGLNKGLLSTGWSAVRHKHLVQVFLCLRLRIGLRGHINPKKPEPRTLNPKP